MKKIKLNVDYRVKKTDDPKEKVDTAKAELSKSYIEVAVTGAYPKGLNGQLRRVFGRIQSKINEAMDSKTFEIELTDLELNFLQGAFKSDNALFTATLAEYVIVLEDELFGIVNN